MPATQAARKREMIANLENDAYIKALVDEAYATISWKSKLQSITAQSTHEAELIALTLAANEAVWIRDLLITLGFALTGHTVVRPKGSEKCIELGARKPLGDITNDSPTDDVVNEIVSGDHDATLPGDDAKYTMPPVPIGNDNASANFAATNPTTSFRNRWIATRYYSVRNHVRNLLLLPTPVPTSLNVADLFTKAIPEFSTFDKHRRACGLVDSTPPPGPRQRSGAGCRPSRTRRTNGRA